MLFSIVIPVYNVEKYLDECMQSILQQLDSINNDCEILLIDDGSTDNSGKICDEYMIKFPTLVKTFHLRRWTQCIYSLSTGIKKMQLYQGFSPCSL